MVLDIALAGVDGPDRVRDLAAHQIGIVRVARTQGDVGLAAGEIEVAVAHGELDPHPRIALVEPLEQWRGGEPGDDRLGAGEPDRAFEAGVEPVDPPLQGNDRVLDRLCIGEQRLPGLGEPVAGRMAEDERMADPALELGEPAVDGGLVHAQRPRGGKRAAVPGNGEEMPEVAPLEHG